MKLYKPLMGMHLSVPKYKNHAESKIYKESDYVRLHENNVLFLLEVIKNGYAFDGITPNVDVYKFLSEFGILYYYAHNHTKITDHFNEI